MTGVCVSMKPTSIEDLTAIVALYRPGPMDSIPKFIANKQNAQRVTYKNPLLEPILRVTYGCIVYQEQVIEIFRTLAGYSMGQADNIRRAISKKKQKIIEAERHVFVYGDQEQGIPGAVAQGCRRRWPSLSMTKSWILVITPSTRPTPCAMPWWPTKRHT